jgi:hypothetical protein
MRKPIAMPSATSIPAAALPPTGEAPPAAGDNTKLPPLPVYSAADLPAAWRQSIATERDVLKLSSDTRTETKGQVKLATRNMCLLTARMFRADPTFNGESVCIELNGKAKVDGWNKRTKAARFAEWNAVAKAARTTDRVNEELWTVADTKEKFVSACVMLGEDKTVTLEAIKEKLKPAKAGPVSDGQRLANAIAELSAINDLRYIAALADTIEGLVEFKAGQNAIGEMLDDEQVKARAKAAKDGQPNNQPMTIREKIALARKQQEGNTVQ